VTASSTRPTPQRLRPLDRRVPNTVLHMTGVALLFAGVGMFVCLLVELMVAGSEELALLVSGILTCSAGFGIWRTTRVGEVKPATIFYAVAVTWITLSLAGTLPYLLSGTITRFDDALFESISGFTCTGSTILTFIEGNSRGVLFWRQMTQWFGGMGVIVLAVAVLPFLSVGGLDLIRAEAPGPDADRLAPRIRGTASRLWLLYVGFTVVSFMALWLAGATPYESASHALTIVSTGGLSTFDDSIAGFDSQLIEIIIIVLMIYGAMNFALHWRALQGHVGVYWRSSEVRWFFGMMLAGCVLVVGILVGDGTAFGDAARGGIFTVVSLLTSTGYGNGEVGNFVLWAVAAQLVLLGAMVVGGMSGSTAGGMKVIRFAALSGVIAREIKRGIRPRAVFSVRFDGVAMSESIVARMLAFAAMYVLLIIAGTVVVVALGSTFDTALGGAAGAMGNMGPSFGEAGPSANFTDGFSRPARMVLAWMMLVGRLEILPMMLVFVPLQRRLQRARRAVMSGR